MELNFTLRENVKGTSSADGLTVVHKLKSPTINSYLDEQGKADMQRLWSIDTASL